jgi:glycosyltransferase involved in cell wall biosynthesis
MCAMTSPGPARPRVAIVIVTYNALHYCRITLRSLRRTRGIRYDVIVVDNRSGLPTRLFLAWEALRGRITRLVFLERNTLFSPANNIGAAVADRACTHVLLLNSDVEIRNARWLLNLLAVHRRGATSYGAPETPAGVVAGGYCLLVDADLYRERRLDEDLPWWWSVSKLQASLLCDGFSVRAIANHDDQVVHFGGKSGPPPHAAWRGLPSREEIRSWFGGRAVEILERMPEA